MKLLFTTFSTLALALATVTAAPTQPPVEAPTAEASTQEIWTDETFEALGYAAPAEGQDFVLIDYTLDDSGEIDQMRVLKTSNLDLTDSAAQAVSQFRDKVADSYRDAERIEKIVYFRPDGTGDFDYRIAEPLLGLSASSEKGREGDAFAQNRAGEIYYYGMGDVLPDFEKAFRWFTQAADQGNADAQYNLGVMYQMGEGVDVQPEKAVFWYQQAAEQKQINALNNLGYVYATGFGVEKDDALAVKYYKQAAKLGHATSQFNLAYRYENGQGVEKDVKRAAKYYRQAADQGHEGAMYCLGRLYEMGQGVDRSLADARDWYRQASLQGSMHAQHRLQQLDAAALN
ncbi:MAG: hypothetical protein E1N59_828 [Puniceicoccaceae bacterium 5H]|nr:MAG: hypothetical protein E1N59_828 [Puniceicoccaceae bacterium 5H]